jgi:hypothetical protein
MKKFPLIFVWFFLGILTVAVNAAAVSYLLHKPIGPITLSAPQDVKIAASVEALPANSDVLGINTTVEGDDARIQIVSNFLARHESPLQPYDEWGRKLVAIADKYGVDFRLLPAIAMQESNLCKVIPPDTHNCLGFGIHSKGTLAFDTFEDSFDRAARELKKNYIDEGRTTPEDIMHKYTPHSDGSWANSVDQWIAEMKYDDRGKGLELKTNADITEFGSPIPVASATAIPTP